MGVQSISARALAIPYPIAPTGTLLFQLKSGLTSAPRLPQVKTGPFTVKSIMGTDEFERGFGDARKGRPFDWRIGGDDIDAAWDYERGRLLAHLAPLDMPLWINGKLNPKAAARALTWS